MQKEKIIFYIVAAAVLILAFAGGMFFQGQRSAPEMAKNSAIVAKLSSSLVNLINAKGQVKEISGRTITLSNGGDEITATLKTSSKISAYVYSKDGKTGTMKDSKLEEIKKGDTVSMGLKVARGGAFEAVSAIIYIKP